MRASTIVFIAALLVPLASAAQPLPIRPGQYEYTIAGFENQKTLECLTAADLKGDLAEVFAREADDLKCTASDIKTTGNRMTFITTCQDDDLRIAMDTEMTFGSDSFTVVTKGKDLAGRMSTTKLSAKRVGECSKPK
jgi:hypothetical protein